MIQNSFPTSAPLSPEELFAKIAANGVTTYDKGENTEAFYPSYRKLEEGYEATVASLEKKTVGGKHWFRVDADLLPQEIVPQASPLSLLRQSKFAPK